MTDDLEDLLKRHTRPTPGQRLDVILTYVVLWGPWIIGAIGIYVIAHFIIKFW